MREALDAADLPAPTPEALEHSRRLSALIAEAIDDAGGAIRFADFMQRALYAPGLGYYSAGSMKFGSEGDFITAPELSPLFSGCLAGACSAVLESIPNSDIVEIGGGSGKLALGLLNTLESLGQLPRRYRILEVSADLRDRQRRLLTERAATNVDRVEWIDALPADVEGVILANEVLDALPFERFRMGSQGPEYLGVGSGRGGFHVVPMPADDGLLQQTKRIEEDLGMSLQSGYASEWSPRLKPFTSDLGRSLKTGALMLFDYGLPRRQLYHPQRGNGTLMCHYRHRAHTDPFLYPGLQDITAWVDFTAVAEAATATDLVLEGFTTQAHFLLESGILEIAGLEKQSQRRRLELAAELRTLTLPGEMGERFKLMVLSRGWNGVLPGLTGRDLSGSL